MTFLISKCKDALWDQILKKPHVYTYAKSFWDMGCSSVVTTIISKNNYQGMFYPDRDLRSCDSKTRQMCATVFLRMCVEGVVVKSPKETKSFREGFDELTKLYT